MAEYRFREHPSCTGGLSPQVIGEALADIEDRHGVVDPSTVVDESRPEESPLHPAFEWRDEVAAEKWRIEQARRVVRSVEVVIDKRNDSTQVAQIAYVNVPSQKGYVSHGRVAQSVELYREAEALFLNRLISAQQQLERIKALSPFSLRPRMAQAAKHLEEARELVIAGQASAPIQTRTERLSLSSHQPARHDTSCPATPEARPQACPASEGHAAPAPSGHAPVPARGDRYH